MTKTMQVLHAFLGGQPMTYREVAALTGFDTSLVTNLATRLVVRGCLNQTDFSYRNSELQITDYGRRQATRTDFYPRKNDKQDQAPTAQKVVESALRNRHALSSVWGAA